MTRVKLPYDVVFDVLPDLVVTRFDNVRCDGSRNVNQDTLDTAAELGYPRTADGVRESLIEHELFHSLISARLWQRRSRVLMFCAGALYVPYYERIHEEAVVLAFQRLYRTGMMAAAFAPYYPQTGLLREAQRLSIEARATGSNK